MKWPYFTQIYHIFNSLHTTMDEKKKRKKKPSSSWLGASRAFHRDLYCQRLLSVQHLWWSTWISFGLLECGEKHFQDTRNWETIVRIFFCVFVDLISYYNVYLFMRSLDMRWLRYNFYVLFSSSPFVRSSRMNSLIHIHWAAHFLHKNIEHTNVRP